MNDMANRFAWVQLMNTFLLCYEDRAALKFMLDEVLRHHSEFRQERKKLHEIEWNAGDDAPSVLGEAEIRATAVVGTASLCLQQIGPKNLQDHWNALSNVTIYGSKTLSDWMKLHSTEFPGFTAYLQAVEYLRALLMKTMAFNLSLTKR